MAPFTNGARSDDLVLRHWQRQQEPPKVPALEGTEMETDEKKEQEDVEGVPKPPEQEYSFAKFNIKPKVPRRYSDDEYNRHLKSDDWSRQETNYLMDLAEEYDLRWVVIADRYDFQPESTDAETNSNALVPAKRYRTMEQMKSRYYFVAATMLAFEHPPSEMSETEFELHEKMLKFDPDRERVRKELASLQLNRTADEVREEAILLEELKRITANEQNFISERRELYSRLEVPISVGNTAMYQSSQGLSQLLSTLLQADKSKKRRSLLGPEGAAVPSPAGQTPVPAGPANARDSLTETPSNAPAPAPTKKAAATAAAAAAVSKEPQPQPVKTLTPAEEARYGVQHHERLAPSVQFRSDRAQKLTQAKSNVQSQKLAAALGELEVPLRLVMPTERVCKEFEKLIHSVNLLLDARKTAEKVDSEIRVLESSKEERERKNQEALEKEKPQVKSEPDQNDPSMPPPPPSAPPAGQAGNNTDNEPSAAAAPASSAVEGHEKSAPHAAGAGDDTAHSQKRSASVLSNGSDKSSKRQKK